MPAVLIPLLFFLASNSFVNGNGALACVSPRAAGAASALLGAAQFGLGAGIGVLVALPDGGHHTTS
jgi:hypothetical protein